MLLKSHLIYNQMITEPFDGPPDELFILENKNSSSLNENDEKVVS